MRLTKRAIDGIRPGRQEKVYWDDTLPNFGLRVRTEREGGKKTFICQYRVNGRSRKLTLGTYGALTVDQARRMARQKLGEVAQGADPVEVKARGRMDPTLAEFAERYMAEHALVKKKARSVEQDRRLLDRIILPKLGGLKLQAVQRSDVARLHHQLRVTPYQANRAVALLSKMFSLAERWGLRPDGSNPCRHIERFKEKARERYLSGEEMARLGAVLAEAEREGNELPQVVLALRLLLLTGSRLNEILTLRWADVDFKGACLHLDDAKAGPRTVPLNVPALEALAGAMRIEGNPWVIPGAKDGAHLVNLNKPWRRIRQRAGIPDVRVHDLRHSHGAVAAAAGMGLPIIGRLLGHTQAQTTLRYSHVAMDPARAASEEVGRRIAEAMAKRPAEKVVPLPVKK